MAYPANFIPEIWSRSLRRNYDKVIVAANLVNRTYEGEIREAGDTVHIRKFGSVTVQTYTPGSDLTDATLDDPMVDLVIDQVKAFSIKVDDVHAVQADIAILDGYTRRAGVAIAETIDTHLISVMVAGADASNTLGAAASQKQWSKTTAYDFLVDMGEALDNNQIPKDGRWLQLPPKFIALLRKSDQFIHATTKGDEVIENGQIGRAAGFRIFETTNIAKTVDGVNGDHWIVPFGISDFVSFASQFTRIEAERVQKQFADRVKGLFIYGSLALEPTAGGVMFIDDDIA